MININNIELAQRIIIIEIHVHLFPEACMIYNCVICCCSESLAFATEPVIASLANVLGNNERMPTPIPAETKVRV